MADALLRLESPSGQGFTFSAATAAYAELQRRFRARWTEVDRLGRNPALQFTGIDAETVSLRGNVYAAHAGGLRQIDRMRALATAGEPLRLTSAAGESLGKWALESVREVQTAFVRGDAPRKQAFDLELKYYGDD